MITFGILMAILGGSSVLAAAIYFAVLGLKRLRDWFFARRMKKFGFILKEKLASNNFRVIQGFFDRDTDTVEEAQAYKADTLDAELQELVPEDEELVFVS